MSEDMRKRTIGGVRVNRFGELTTQSEDVVMENETRTEMMKEEIANVIAEDVGGPAEVMLQTCLQMMCDRGIIASFDMELFRIAIWRDHREVTEVVTNAIMEKFGETIGGETNIMTRIMESTISEAIIEYDEETHDILYLAEM